MSETNEAAFERHIREWLIGHGGHQRVKVRNAGDGPRDFGSGYGGDASAAQTGFTQFPRKQFDESGIAPTGTFNVLGVP